MFSRYGAALWQFSQEQGETAIFVFQDAVEAKTLSLTNACNMVHLLHSHLDMCTIRSELDSLRATLDEVCVRVSKGEASTAYLFRCGQALSDSILLLREELDAKERKRKQLAVANSVVKVVVSLAPIVGGVIGSSVEAAANILSGIDPASFSSGANMMSFVQDFDKVKAVDTILAQIPEVLSDEQRAALDGGLSLENVRQEFAMAANFGLQRPQSSEVDEDGAPQSLLRTCAAQSSSSGEAKCAFNDVIDSEDLR